MVQSFLNWHFMGFPLFSNSCETIRERGNHFFFFFFFFHPVNRDCVTQVQDGGVGFTGGLPEGSSISAAPSGLWRTEAELLQLQRSDTRGSCWLCLGFGLKQKWIKVVWIWTYFHFVYIKQCECWVTLYLFIVSSVCFFFLFVCLLSN